MRKLVPLFLLTACALGGKAVTMDAFYEVDVSSSTNEVIAALGEPYAIHKMCDGTLEYEYIERIKIGARDAEERRYILVIKDGVVISKKVKQSSPLPQSFDSYDMQTTHKDPG